MAKTGGTEITQRQLTRLKWLTTLAPTFAVFLYETVRHDLFDRWFPTAYGNLLVGLLTLVLAYGFSELVFGVVERLQRRALARSREVAALQAVVEERERLSRELHDGLAQLVAYVLVRLDTVRELVATSRQREAAVELERLRAAADDLYADVRESITGLRARVAERGLLPALLDYLEEYEERYAIAVDLQAGAVSRELPPLAGLQLFRIVQEALANVRKHAGAQRAWVAFASPEPSVLRMVIGDNGRGFDPFAAVRAEPRSFGLAIMRERAASLGGTLTIESRPGDGTRVVVAVPFGQTAAEVEDGSLAAPAR